MTKEEFLHLTIGKCLLRCTYNRFLELLFNDNLRNNNNLIFVEDIASNGYVIGHYVNRDYVSHGQPIWPYNENNRIFRPENATIESSVFQKYWFIIDDNVEMRYGLKFFNKNIDRINDLILNRSITVADNGALLVSEGEDV